MTVTKKRPNLSNRRKVFNEIYLEYCDSEILKEILYSQKQNRDKLERIRKNTSILVWFLIVIPIILTILFYTVKG
jgi:hypothetical protein